MNGFLAELLPYLAALYLFDALVRAWPSEVVFYSWARRRYRFAGPGFRFALPFPPSEAFPVSTAPVCLGRDSIGYSSSPISTASPLPASFEEEPLDGEGRFSSDERSVRRGARTLFSAGSPEAAAYLARRLEALRAAPPAERAKARAHWTNEAFDVAELKKELERYRAASEVGTSAGWALLALFFAALPLSLYTPLGRFVGPSWWLLGAAVAWYFAVRGLLAFLKEAGLDRPSRVLAFLHFVFLPVSAARAWAAPARLVVAKYDFVTVAAAFLDEAAFAACARKELARLRSLPASCGLSVVREGLAEREKRVLRLVRDVLGEKGLPPPVRRDASTTAFCPLCMQEYREGFESCADCGLPLEGFETGRPGTES